jgi:hypothetical protein
MTSIRGTIRIGEATPTVKSTARRQRGGTGPFLLLLAGLWIGGALAGFLVGWAFGLDRILAACGGAVAGIIIYRPLCGVLSLRLHRKTLTAQGVPLDLPVQFEITDEAFVYEIADVRMRAKWSAVSEMFYDKGWWIFMVQSDPWFAADRFFAGDEEKRAFLHEVLGHMSDEARGRSAEAVKFVEASP